MFLERICATYKKLFVTVQNNKEDFSTANILRKLKKLYYFPRRTVAQIYIQYDCRSRTDKDDGPFRDRILAVQYLRYYLAITFGEGIFFASIESEINHYSSLFLHAQCN